MVLLTLEKSIEISVREKYDWLLPARPPPGIKPTTQVCVLMGIKPVTFWFLG